MLNTSIHRNLLLQILKDIYSNITLGPKLGFKGGTAAYLCYGLGRFSVDLDFDLLDEKQKQWAEQHLKQETIFLLHLQENDAAHDK